MIADGHGTGIKRRLLPLPRERYRQLIHSLCFVGVRPLEHPIIFLISSSDDVIVEGVYDLDPHVLLTERRFRPYQGRSSPVGYQREWG